MLYLFNYPSNPWQPLSLLLSLWFCLFWSVILMESYTMLYFQISFSDWQYHLWFIHVFSLLIPIYCWGILDFMDATQIYFSIYKLKDILIPSSFETLWVNISLPFQIVSLSRVIILVCFIGGSELSLFLLHQLTPGYCYLGKFFKISKYILHLFILYKF